MGKVFDALERHKKETAINAERLPLRGGLSDSRIDHGLSIKSVLNPKLVAHSAPDSLDAENFKILRAQILFPKNGTRPRSIMVTSAFPGEGKTYVASNLAVSIATGINEHVLLIDCDFRRPTLHNMLGYSNKEGLNEYLMGKSNLPDLLIRTRVEKLSLLTAGSTSAKPAEILSSNMMKDFLVDVRERYQDRYIILDAPPSHVTAETSVLANYVDGIIFVVMAGKSPRATIQKNIENLGRKRIVGIVFNGYNESSRYYQKYYKKYYK